MIRLHCTVAGITAALLVCLSALTTAAQEQLPADEAHSIGVDAYVYFYPLVTMDITRRQLTNIDPAGRLAAGAQRAVQPLHAAVRAEIRRAHGQMEPATGDEDRGADGITSAVIPRWSV